MRFRLLGPLEVEQDERLVDLGGRRQRAALAFLLLHANQVVSTSQLLSALWAGDDAPVTARKILQNAVWKLRTVLARPPMSEDTPELSTRSPGYLLRVPPPRVDLLVYQQRVAAGRAALAAGDPRLACESLNEALSLWRGPVLADLVEEGTCWPELTAVQTRRLDVMEDHFEAALACGRHRLILRDLKTLVESEPLRERASRQLMLALYRCGRQAEALSVFGRVRTALVEGLGLEPGRELQQLQQSILTHDPALRAPQPTARDTVTLASPTPAEAGPDRSDEPRATATEEFRPAPPGEPQAADDTGDDRDDPPLPEIVVRPASVVMFRFGLRDDLGALPPEDSDRVLDTLAQLAMEKAELHGGQVTSILGSVLLAVFTGESEQQSDAVERAVRAAAAVRECVSAAAGTPAPPPPVRGLTLRAAVTSGEAFLPGQPGGVTAPPWVGGAIVDTCHTMLARVRSGEIHVCDTTRRLTENTAIYRRACGPAPAPWELHAVADDPNDWTPHLVAGTPAHAGEVEHAQHVLPRTRLRSASHLTTLIDSPGRGRTGLLAELPRGVERDCWACVPSGTVRPPTAGRSLSALAEILATYGGIDPAEPVHHAFDWLRETLDRLENDPHTRRTLCASLSPMLPTPRPGPRARLRGSGTSRRGARSWQRRRGSIGWW